MRHVRVLSLAILGFTSIMSSPARAEDPETSAKTFQDSIPQHILDQNAAFLTFTLENDLFGSGRDENYTNGVRLTCFDTGFTPPDLLRTIADVVPFFAVNETTSVAYSIGQNMYTPNDIREKFPDPTDRPYAGFLYGSAALTTIEDNHIDQLEITLGMVGPVSLAEQTQEIVHDAINAFDPSGWDAQLDNEPGVILSWERRWPRAATLTMGTLDVSAAPYVGLSAGNVYTYAASGLTVQLTETRHKWQATPPRVRPAIPGSGFFAIPENEFAWSVFAGVEGRAIGHNIFLDGNTFEESPSVGKKHIVADANVGFSLTYGRAQFAYTLNWRSKEFDTQDKASLFGALSLGYRF